LETEDQTAFHGDLVATDIEINLRIPAVKEPLQDASGWPINNAEVRFLQRIFVAAVPKPGDVLNLTAQPDAQFPVTVVRADWHEEKQMFVVACKYAKTSIPRPHYLAIVQDPAWAMKPLLG
jgi:hypothetical protein